MNQAVYAFVDAPQTASLLKHWYALLDHIPIGVYICDRDGLMSRYNAHAAQLWGVSPRDDAQLKFIGPLKGYELSGAPLDPMESPVAVVLRSQKPVRGREIALERPDGTRLIILANADPLFDANGELIGAVNCIQDITAQKQAEAELQAKKRELQELLEALPAAVYTTDAEGRITFFNQAATQMAGRVPRLGEDMWCVTWKLFKTDGTPLAHDECPMAIALKENRAVRGEEAVAERPDGARIPFIPYPTPIRDAAGNLVGAVNMLVDVSERKQAEYQQRMLLDELNHRVKNNLQMLHSLLRTSQRETNDDHARSVLEDAAHRVGAIAAAQRVLYSAESATSFSTNEFLQAVCHAAQQAFAGDVKIQVAPSTGALSNEISMPLALILNELLTNAVKHGLKGRRHGTIKVQLARAGDRFNLTVEDDGTGFELRPSSRRSSGLGLVNGLARQLGGTFEVQRASGARCIVDFPENRNLLH